MHDSDVSTTTNGEGEVEDLTLEEIRALEVDDSDFDDAFPGLQVPTFEGRWPPPRTG
jgi:glycerophosphoryl diester phosphodiesterase